MKEKENLSCILNLLNAESSMKVINLFKFSLTKETFLNSMAVANVLNACRAFWPWFGMLHPLYQSAQALS